jgi:hypothetical protein
MRYAVKRGFDGRCHCGMTMAASCGNGFGDLYESGRPIIFRQERGPGADIPAPEVSGMRADAEKDGIPRWASNGDPRITARPPGRSRIDELPPALQCSKVK